MKSKLLWAMGWVTLGAFTALQGCSDDDGGTAGNGGASGSTGKGGSSGKGGTSGASGSAGKGGSSGQGGTSGASGSAGKGGTSGTSGTAGTTSGGGQGGEAGGAGGEGGQGASEKDLDCDAYCALYYVKHCDQATANTYTSQANCQTMCKTSTWGVGTPGTSGENTVNCRFYHSSLASAVTTPDQMHCGHASYASTSDSCNP